MTEALPSASDLDVRARLLFSGAVVADHALRTGLASVLTGAMLPGVARGSLWRERRALDFYARLAAERDTAVVFEPPEPATVTTTAGRGPSTPGGRVELLRFRSAYVARNPALRRAYARHENNTTARAQHWRHSDGPRPTLCVIHGFGASPAWFNRAFFSLEQFFAEGYDVLLYTLPFHGSRRGTNVPLNGVELFAHGMAHFSEAMFQAVHDFRVLLGHLEEQGAPRVGVTGLSLGGYVTALLAAADDRLDFAVPNAAVTWLPPMMAGWFPANIAGTVLRTAASVPADLLENALASHSPLTYEPVLAKDRLMVVAGLGDRLAPPEQSILLWEHWQRPELHWFPGSHVLHFGRGAYLAAMGRLMGEEAA